MTRRDVIIVSVLVNSGLLAVLFLTAQKSGPENHFAPQAPSEMIALEEEVLIPLSPFRPAEPVQQPAAIPTQPTPSPADEMPKQTVDEIDNVLREYLPEAPLQTAAVEVSPKVETQVQLQQNIVEVTVKKGDMLEKIARANFTTVEAIKKANGLNSDKLKVGQKLKVPVGTKPVKPSQPVTAAVSPLADSEPVFYTIKTGDNPWKIAKQFNVRFEDLLKWNNLDEESGKNLKVGDKIRVK